MEEAWELAAVSIDDDNFPVSSKKDSHSKADRETRNWKDLITAQRIVAVTGLIVAAAALYNWSITYSKNKDEQRKATFDKRVIWDANIVEDQATFKIRRDRVSITGVDFVFPSPALSETGFYRPGYPNPKIDFGSDTGLINDIFTDENAPYIQALVKVFHANNDTNFSACGAGGDRRVPFLIKTFGENPDGEIAHIGVYVATINVTNSLLSSRVFQFFPEDHDGVSPVAISPEFKPSADDLNPFDRDTYLKSIVYLEEYVPPYLPLTLNDIRKDLNQRMKLMWDNEGRTKFDDPYFEMMIEKCTKL